MKFKTIPEVYRAPTGESLRLHGHMDRRGSSSFLFFSSKASAQHSSQRSDVKLKSFHEIQRNLYKINGTSEKDFGDVEVV